jgi:hypothetical protein
MRKEENLIKVFSGPESSAILLKSRLDEKGISALIKNDSEDAFFGVTPRVVDLYVKSTDLKITMNTMRDLQITPEK